MNDIARTIEAGRAEAEALALARAGDWRLTPVHTPDGNGGCSCGDPKCGRSIGKHPRLAKWEKAPVSDEEMVRGWYKKWPGTNYGIVLGEGLGAFEMDGKGGQELHARITAKLERGGLGKFPETVEATSGGGGRHLLFRYDETAIKLPNITVKIGEHEGIELFVERKQIVGPGSLHKSGGQYAWVRCGAVAELSPEYLRAYVAALKEEKEAHCKSEASVEERQKADVHELFPGMWEKRKNRPDLDRLFLMGERTGLHEACRVVFPPEPYLQMRERLRRSLAFIAEHDPKTWLEMRGGPGEESGWIRIVAAMKSLLRKGSDWPEEEAYNLLDEFSQKTSKDNYNEEKNRNDWNTLSPDGGLTEASIFGIAKDLAEARNLPNPTLRLPSDGPASIRASGAQGGAQGDAAGPHDSSNTSNEIDCTDIGNGRRLVRQFGDRLRYVHALKRWLIWDGTNWRIDDDLGIVRFAKDTVNQMHRQASEMEYSKARDDFHKWAFASSTRERLSAMIEMAKSEVEVILAPDKLDANPWLLGVQNGVIDLKSGAFRPARQEDYITKCASIAYDPEATCPNFLAFIYKVTGGNKDLIGYLQRVCGYVLTGSVAEEKIFVLWGGGGNGKTTFREILRDLLGDYAISADAGLLTSRKEPGGATPEIARLQGRRFVSVNETAKDDELNEPRVKFITSNERIAGRRLYAEYVEFMPTHKAILSTNEKPIVKETNDGIWRRLQLVPFTVKIGKDEDIIDFRERVLRPELPGILNWALAGLADYLKRRLDPPDVVKIASDEYRSDMDIMSQWLAERCECDPRAPGIATAELHRDFVEFTGWRNMSKIAFARELSKKGFEPEKGSHGRRLIKGLRLNHFLNSFRPATP